MDKLWEERKDFEVWVPLESMNKESILQMKNLIDLIIFLS